MVVLVARLPWRNCEGRRLPLDEQSFDACSEHCACSAPSTWMTPADEKVVQFVISAAAVMISSNSGNAGIRNLESIHK